MTETILVTGATGFLAKHVIAALLKNEYAVRGTVRDLGKAAAVQATLAANHIPHLDRLSFVAIDLTQDAGWEDAMRGIDAVMSVAAPVFVNGETATTTMTTAATDGTLRLLKAADRAGIYRVIMTANLGAVAFSQFDRSRPTTEADWTAPEQIGLSAYERSKLIAEQAAWNFAKTSGGRLHLTTINPGAMLGPSLDDHVSDSFGIVANLFDTPLIPNVPMHLVDVRDVADLHVKALQNDAAIGSRFIAVTDEAITMPQMAAVIRESRPALAKRLSKWVLPAWLIRAAGHFNQQAKEGALFLRIQPKIANQHAKTVLNWQPRSNQAAILAAVDSLQKAGKL
ncbi:NAD-dependent epimerase/dehydratase family protein [Lacticaseibacillus mingshuiensis]|uniref:NAD-dependent epimerase/dehydratase family protein n=1 Tax=Lacticaseibacillus mingshuiensis TaxID=2799574 RepID=A0ABW4CMB9_9LACO|nr:NAD-dependent epimerase/dehydratase family protein [Lacticaseibacillus mingshuiensis]